MIEHSPKKAEECFRIGGVLKYDPLTIFRGSTTPAGLYARSRWIGLDNDSWWQKDFDKTVAALRKGQLPNGSWQDSPLLTIHRLFGLHLTVRNPDDRIHKALNWISNLLNAPPDHKISDLFGKQLSLSSLENLPFVRGNTADLLRSALLFLATVFGISREKVVAQGYAEAMNGFDYRQGRWPSLASTQNFLRALVVHPEYSNSEVVQKVVRTLADMQHKSGSWRGPINSYLTINALGHLDTEDAGRQLVSAFSWLKQIQNKDGSWGRTEKEWKTFLVVHTMRKRFLL